MPESPVSYTDPPIVDQWEARAAELHHALGVYGTRDRILCWLSDRPALETLIVATVGFALLIVLIVCVNAS